MRSWPGRSSGRLVLLVGLPLAVVLLPPAVVRVGLSALSPFLGLSSALAGRAAGITLVCSLPMTALVLWRRRFFCRFLCPMGWIVETCGKVRPGARYAYARIPRLGQWAVLLTLGGAIATCPLFLFLDPLALLAGAAGAGTHWAYAVAFAGIVAVSTILPGLWCARLCPLGGLQDLAVDLRGVLARRRIEPADGANPEGTPVARRAFIGLCGGAATGVLATRLPANTGTIPLRPPGAPDEATMTTLCVRCGSCVRVCPSGIIRPDLAPPDFTRLLLPTLSFAEGHCLDDCSRCGEACPTGAIAHLPVAAKNERPIGLARIDQKACLLSHEVECGVCVTMCKRNAIVEEFSKETYSVAVRVLEDQCNGCGACVAVCPPRAIHVEPTKR